MNRSTFNSIKEVQDLLQDMSAKVEVYLKQDEISRNDIANMAFDALVMSEKLNILLLKPLN